MRIFSLICGILLILAYISFGLLSTVILAVFFLFLVLIVEFLKSIPNSGEKVEKIIEENYIAKLKK